MASKLPNKAEEQVLGFWQGIYIVIGNLKHSPSLMGYSDQKTPHQML